jgi:hypothetical protein
VFHFEVKARIPIGETQARPAFFWHLPRSHNHGPPRRAVDRNKQLFGARLSLTVIGFRVIDISSSR